MELFWTCLHVFLHILNQSDLNAAIQSNAITTIKHWCLCHALYLWCLDAWNNACISNFVQQEINMKRVKPTRCYTMVYWTLWIAQHVSGSTMPIVRSLRLYRWPQHMAPHLGYGRLLVWCMALGFWSVRLEGCFTDPSNLQPCTRPATCHNQGEEPYAETICIVASSWRWA